ncbi:hypothetical protein VYU27_002904 [Nannochloropsis oceanica]
MSSYVLHESASGYALFELVQHDDIASLTDEVQASIQDVQRFGRTVKLKAFQPFTSAENALENMNSISEHVLSDDLKHFLELNLPKAKKAGKGTALGVIEPALGTIIQEELSFPCKSDEATREVLRGIRLHFNKYIKELDGGLLEKSQLGLGHSYSRAKVKFNPGRSDNMIIQSIALLDQLDKDLNTFAMRVREWYCWHFPELRDLVKDNYVFARCAAYVQDRTTLTEEKLDGLTEITLDEELSQSILTAAKTSMGMDTSAFDMGNIVAFTTRMVKLAEYRKHLHAYLLEKMATVAPNLGTLIGETVAARLIAKAGSLTSLAKCPASTIQILGAEKALFRALKTKGNTPKYGLIYHSSFIGRAAAKNKGRISRYLANKCSIASRIDTFTEDPTTKYGEKLKEQVEERLRFYDTGAAPRKNVDVMTSVRKELEAAGVLVVGAGGEDGGKEKKKKKEKKEKKKGKEVAEEEEDEEDEMEVSPKKDKKKRKTDEVEESAETKKKKKKKDKK